MLATKTTVTYGTGPLARIYNTLRKRSQRHVGDEWLARPTANATDWDLWEEMDHIAYVAGIRDALNAVKEAGLK